MDRQTRVRWVAVKEAEITRLKEGIAATERELVKLRERVAVCQRETDYQKRLLAAEKNLLAHTNFLRFC